MHRYPLVGHSEDIASPARPVSQIQGFMVHKAQLGLSGAQMPDRVDPLYIVHLPCLQRMYSGKPR